MAPPVFLITPFLLLLLLIAIAPIFLSHFWHKWYPHIAIGMGLFVLLFYFLVLRDFHSPVETLMEYFSFICLLFALFTVSGGIVIEIDKKGTPFLNILILFIGAVLSNFIGTTGASILLIRPYMRVNSERLKPYHIIFFIFSVSNMGGSLTAIGDPPLFIGFLKGVPFFWTIEHIWEIWIFSLGMLFFIFYIVDKNNKQTDEEEEVRKFSERIAIRGYQNLFMVLIILGSVFLDPGKISWLPHIYLFGKKFSFLRELIMLTVGYISFKTTPKQILLANDFNFEPIKEVAFLFFGIFCTMIPALASVSAFANSDAGKNFVTTNTLYWFTGLLSSFLDNAPTYLNFLTAAMSKVNLDINTKSDVLNFTINHSSDLLAISVGAVFFGAMTYIGNGPNFMVKSMAEQNGIPMPSFFMYIIKYSIPVLLPIFLLVWWIFI